MATENVCNVRPSIFDVDHLCGMPFHPRFVREVVHVQADDSMIVDGIGELCVIKGAATQILPSLIPLMDGTHTQQELEQRLPHVPPDLVRSTISLLHAWGLVENARPTASKVTTSPTVSFFRRFRSVMGVNQSGQEAFEKVASSEIVIVIPSAAQAESQHDILRSILVESDLGAVTLVQQQTLNEHIPSAKAAGKEVLLISMAFQGEDVERHSALDELSRESGLPWLRFVLDQNINRADVGPVFTSDGPCYRCFYDVHCAPLNSGHRPLAKHGLTRTDYYFWTSMVALYAIHLLSNAPITTGAGVRRHDLEQGAWRDVRTSRIPGCKHCHTVPPFITTDLATKHIRDLEATSRFTSTALVFENAVSRHSAPDISSRVQYDQYRLGNSLSRQAKQFSNCPQIGLERTLLALESGTLDLFLEDSSIPCPSRFCLGELSTLLMTTAGLRGIRKRDNIPQRWAATAGNLGSVELFLAVRDVEGLEPGFYFYQPHQHSLAMFRRRAGALEPPEFINRAFFNDRAETPDLLVLFTGAFHRVARKYGSFALKLINLDAGVAYSQLQLVARSLNIPCCLGTRWADQLIEDQLNLTPFQEQVTAAVALYQGRLEPSGAELSRCVERWNRPRVSKYLPKSINEFSNLTTGEVCEKLFRESRSTEASLDLPAQAVPATLSHEWRSDVTGVPLPHRCYGGLSVEQTLHKRISVRRYGSSAVSIKQVSTMLTCAHRGDLQDWPDEHRHGLPLTFLVLLSLASEIEPGIYTYNSDKHQLVLYRNRLTSEECSGLFVQNEFAFSPAIIWIAGNLAAACARHGESGYRQLLLRAGAAGHRLWMAGSAMGLVGTLTAGLVARTARKYLGMDDYKRTSLLAFPTGAPYDPADRIHNSCQISVPAMTKVVSKYIPMKHVSKSPMSDCRTGTEPRRRSPIPMAESQILLQREFFEKAMSLRNEFEERFLSKQREGVTPFTYAFCEDRYQLLTADAESLFADDTLQAFLSRLGEWVSGTLSLHQISRPQVRVYIRGCSRSFVKDEINACWHFMLPFTPLSRKRLGSNRAQIVIQTQSGPSNGSGANRDTLVHADLEFNCLLVHAVRNAYKIAPRLDSMNPMSGLAFIDGYFW